ncbi:MAG: MipA/OmpV family protein [Sulfitobacter sp.]
MRKSLSIVLAFVAAVSALPGAAQDRSLSFALRSGLSAQPDFPGSDNVEVKPDVGFTFGALSWGGRRFGPGIGIGAKTRLSWGSAFRVIGSRDASDAPELAGLADIDTAVELGLGLTYRQRYWQAFGELRQGFGGHDGVTGTIGADVIMHLSDRLTVSVGPRLNFGNANFAGTYFGVNAAEAVTSGIGRFDADGGLLGAGVALEGRYQLKGPWAVEGGLSYERLQNSAADSPITAFGSEDQLRVSIGLSRTFTLNF